MLSRSIKALFYTVMGPIMAANGIRHRATHRPGGPVKAHLGPGQNKYLDGWVNCDANIFTGKADRWVDLRNPLPFFDGSLDAVYSHHVAEHLPDMALHFRDVFRALKPGGVYRVGGPDLDMAIDRYLAKDYDWFGTWPTAHRSVGGRLSDFLVCRGEHMSLFSDDYVREMMEDAGFTAIGRVGPRESAHSDLFSDVFRTEEEQRPNPVTLFLEGVKPGGVQ